MPLAPRPPPPPPSPAVLERLAQMETWRRARAHRRSEMRRPLSERQAERAALAKAAAAARERRLEHTKEAVELRHRAKSLARELMRGAREDEKQVRFVKQGVLHFERQEVRRHCTMIHRWAWMQVLAMGLHAKRICRPRKDQLIRVRGSSRGGGKGPRVAEACP